MTSRPLSPAARHAFALLGVLPEQGPDAARRAFRRLARRCHPDLRGGTGDGAAFRRLRAAHDAVMAWHAEAPDELAPPVDVEVVWPVPRPSAAPPKATPRRFGPADAFLAALLLGWIALGLVLRR